MTSTCPSADALSALVDDALPPAARDALLAIREESDPECRTALLMGHAAWRLGDWGRVREAGDQRAAFGIGIAGDAGRLATRAHGLVQGAQDRARRPQRVEVDAEIEPAPLARRPPVAVPEQRRGVLVLVGRVQQAHGFAHRAAARGGL